MKKYLLCLGSMITLTVNAQFVQQPMPMQLSDFTAIKKGGYTKAFKYKIEDGLKTLVSEAEYGTGGLAAALYEKGTNDNGDSINISSTYYKYPFKGKLTQESKEQVDADETKTIYTYNAKGQLIKQETIEIDPPTSTYKYDVTGKLKEIFVTRRMPTVNESGDADGKSMNVPYAKYLVTCDAKGRIIEKKQYNLRGDDSKKPEASFKWTYDAAGRIVAYKYQSLIGSDYYSVTYTYNIDGLLKSSVEQREGEQPINFVYEYCKTCKQSWMQ